MIFGFTQPLLPALATARSCFTTPTATGPSFEKYYGSNKIPHVTCNYAQSRAHHPSLRGSTGGSSVQFDCRLLVFIGISFAPLSVQLLDMPFGTKPEVIQSEDLRGK